MDKLNFRAFLEAAETGVISELSIHSRELNLPTRVERDLEVEKVLERPLSTIWLKGKTAPIELTRQEWWALVQGKRDIRDVAPGDLVDIEYYANRRETANDPKPYMAIHIRDGRSNGGPSPKRQSSPAFDYRSWVFGRG